MVRIFVSSRRPCDSDAFATSSYGTNFAHPLSAATFVSAAVKVVFPWSMCPIVPTFTCGLDRSNFSFAIEVRSVCLLRSLNARHHLFAHVGRRLLVPIEVHRVRRATLRSRSEIRGISKHLRQRHARVDDLRASAVFLRL